jgi:hypothetical protein
MVSPVVLLKCHMMHLVSLSLVGLEDIPFKAEEARAPTIVWALGALMPCTHGTKNSRYIMTQISLPYQAVTVVVLRGGGIIAGVWGARREREEGIVVPWGGEGSSSRFNTLLGAVGEEELCQMQVKSFRPSIRVGWLSWVQAGGSMDLCLKHKDKVKDKCPPPK